MNLDKLKQDIKQGNLDVSEYNPKLMSDMFLGNGSFCFFLSAVYLVQAVVAHMNVQPSHVQMGVRMDVARFAQIQLSVY